MYVVLEYSSKSHSWISNALPPMDFCFSSNVSFSPFSILTTCRKRKRKRTCIFSFFNLDMGGERKRKFYPFHGGAHVWKMMNAC